MNTNLQDILNGRSFLKLTGRCLWSFSGTDRARYLNGQCTADVAKLKKGDSCWASVLSIKARMEGDIRIACDDSRLLVDADPQLQESLGKRLGKYIIADDVEMEDISGDWHLFHTLAAELAPFELPAGSLQFSSNRVGQPGTDIWIPTSSKPDLPCGSESDWNAVRISNGMPLWGVDMTGDNLPPEMPFARFGGLSYSKGCYIGQEVVSRIKSIGHVNKKLCLLEASTEDLPSTPAEVLDGEGKSVGKVTSCSLSPNTGQAIALATLARACSTPGTQLNIGGQAFQIAQTLIDD